MENSRREADADGIKVPTTLAEYTKQCGHQQKSTPSFDMTDDFLYDEDDYYQDSSDEEEDLMSDDNVDSEPDLAEDSGTA